MNKTLARISCMLLIGLTIVTCNRSDGPTDAPAKAKKQFLSVGTAPIGGAFFVVGGALIEVLNANKGVNNWEATPEATKGTQENIRRLSSKELDLGMANSAISHFAVRGEAGWDRVYDIAAVMTLAPNIAMFITPESSGIKTMADLKGKRVVVGPAGAGFEYFIRPLLEVHGLTFDDFTPLYNTQNGAVDMLADGSADAAFLGGAVPTASITQASASMDIHFIPFGDTEKQKAIDQWPFFNEATIPAETYRGQAEPYIGLNVGSMHLITRMDADEELIYQITKTIYENRAQVVEKHPAGKAINPKNAARYTGTPFHPGAIRYYKEAGIWPEDAAAN